MNHKQWKLSETILQPYLFLKIFKGGFLKYQQDEKYPGSGVESGYFLWLGDDLTSKLNLISINIENEIKSLKKLKWIRFAGNFRV